MEREARYGNELGVRIAQEFARTAVRHLNGVDVGRLCLGQKLTNRTIVRLRCGRNVPRGTAARLTAAKRTVIFAVVEAADGQRFCCRLDATASYAMMAAMAAGANLCTNRCMVRDMVSSRDQMQSFTHHRDAGE